MATSTHKKTVGNRKNNSETSQNPPSELFLGPQVRTLSKSNESYWKPKLRKRTYQHDGKHHELPDWHVQLGYKGVQRWVALETPNKTAAAKRARDKWVKLQAGGWPAIVADRLGVIQSPTLGEYLTAVKTHGGLAAPTFGIYSSKLRTLIAGVFGVKGGASKFNYHDGGAKRWRSKIEAIRLRRITPAAVKRWQDRHLKQFADNPAKEAQAKVTVNSQLRAARSLFAKKILEQIPHIQLPSPHPFAEIRPPKVKTKRYVSKIDAATLYAAAVRELAQPDDATLVAAVQAITGKHKGGSAPDPEGLLRWKLSPLWERERTRRREAFKVLCLALYAGLRRDEIDTLTWAQIDFTHGSIHVRNTEHGRVKSADSERSVDIDAGLVALLRQAQAESQSEFVLQATAKAKPEAASYHHYRCARLFRWLIDWLREHGVEARMGLHMLRKEYGSIMTAEHGISAASRSLGHASIQLTQAVYVGQKVRTAVAMPTSQTSTPSTS
jgi:integrase